MALSAVKKEPAKPKQGEPAPAADAAAAPKPAGKSKKLLFIGLGLAVLAGGGGGAWWFMHHEAGPDTPKAEAAKPPVFAPLDPFTVNLQQEDVAQFVQLGLTLRVTDEAAIADLKLHMPEVRDRILLMLSAKKGSELLTLEGKRKLAVDIQVAINDILVPGSAKARTEPAKPAAKPAAQPAESAEKGEKDAAPQGEAAAEAPAQEPVAAEPAAAAEPAGAPAPVLPVTGVLFTSFIVQ